jgi:hypothetical protein
MPTRVRTLRPTVFGLTVLLLSFAVTCNTGDKGGAAPGFPCACDHLVYVQSTVNPPDVTVHTTGNPLGSGDQVFWTLITPNATLNGITMPDSSCAGATTAPWTPYSHLTYGPTTAWSGPMTAPPGSVADGTYSLSYRVVLPTGGGPCGHIIIVKP